MVGGTHYSNKIIDQAVVKFGAGVKKEGANNQRGRYGLLNPDIVRVPRVYRFFVNGPFGYLVMEYRKGRTPDRSDDPGLVRRVAYVVAQYSDIASGTPGPLGGGVSRGLPWPDDQYLTFRTIQEMQEFYNSRLARADMKLRLAGCKVVLSHLDIAPRNSLLLEDGSLCLLDWESAGFYPRYFEHCGQQIGKDVRFNRLLLESMENLTDEEKLQADLCCGPIIMNQVLHVSNG